MHLTSGLFFERLPNGWARIKKHETSDTESPLVFEVVTDASGWASIVTAMQEEITDATQHAKVQAAIDSIVAAMREEKEEKEEIVAVDNTDSASDAVLEGE